MITGKKIFVVGNSRSGTTLMGRILGGNSAIFTFHELHFFEQLWVPTEHPESLSEEKALQLVVRLLTIQKDGYYNQTPGASYLPEAETILAKAVQPVTAVSIFSAFLTHLTTENQKHIPCDQTPRNVYYLSEIFSLYPEAYVVNIVRDPRDVLLSQKNKWKRSLLGAKNIPKGQLLRFWANYHPMTMSLMWISGIKAAEEHRQHPRLIQVKFEELLQQPENTVQSICKFLDINYQSSMLTVPQIGSSHQPDQITARGLNSKAVARWQSVSESKNELYVCEKITHSYIDFFAYPRGYHKPNPLVLLVLAFSWPIKLGLAFLLNLGRFLNFGTTLKKRLGIPRQIPKIEDTTAT